MASSLDAAILQRTRETLGKVIKKPPLTDKLLSRPPFRLLHDIVSEVNKNTGFFNGLYSAAEMDAKSIQDKDSKMAFLQKAIDTLSFTNGEVIRLKPTKVVAGHDAEKTNEFLQVLSISILKQLDSSEAIQRVLRGEKPSESLAREKKKRSGKENDTETSSKRRSRSKERPGEERKRSGGEGAARTKPRDSTSKDSGEGREGQMSLRSKSHQSLKDKSSKSSDRPTHRPSHKRPPPDSESSSKDNEQGRPPEDATAQNIDSVEDEGLGSETRLDRPSSAKGSRKREMSNEAAPGNSSSSIEPSPPPDQPTTTGVTEESRDNPSGTANRSLSPPPSAQGTLVPPMRRPGSARPAPPKVIKSSASTSEMVPGMIQSDGAPPPSVIMDHPGQGDLDDDDNQYVVEDSTPLAPPPEEAFPSKDEETATKPEGALTKNIMAMKERLEGDLPQEGQAGLPVITEAQRRKEREMIMKEIEKLQASIQTLCKSANPLGKIMDYVQEDIDSMQKELEMWKSENERHSEAIRKEESITEQELSPLRAQLEELEARINEQVDLISATKANILRNEEKTQQILSSMSFASR